MKESFYRTNKSIIKNPQVISNTLSTNNFNTINHNVKNNIIDKTTSIKNQLLNNEIANFTGLTNLGEDGLKIISDIVNSNFNIIYLNTNNNNHTLSNSLTLANINTPNNTPLNHNHISSTPINTPKKNVKFSEDVNSNKKSILSYNNNNVSPNPFTLRNSNMIENENYKLKEIKLIKCNINDEGFNILCNCFDKNGSIQTLNLKGNKIKDKSVKNIIHLIKSNKTLKNLILSQNLFSQAKKENLKINAKLCIKTFGRMQ